MRYILTLLLLSACASCKKSQRSVEICLIDSKASVANCALGDKQFKLEFPSNMQGYYSWDRQAMHLLAERLEQCEIDGKLPRSDKTWQEMRICIIEASNCGNRNTANMQGFYATSPDGAAKIASKLSFCTR